MAGIQDGKLDQEGHRGGHAVRDLDQARLASMQTRPGLPACLASSGLACLHVFTGICLLRGFACLPPLRRPPTSCLRMPHCPPLPA